MYPAGFGTHAHQRERDSERDLAGAARPPVLPPRGLGAEDRTMVLAAQEDQVHSAAVLLILTYIGQTVGWWTNWQAPHG